MSIGNVITTKWRQYGSSELSIQTCRHPMWTTQETRTRKTNVELEIFVLDVVAVVTVETIPKKI
jgi:hypothetical protein